MSTDKPSVEGGDGFTSSDPCGFIMGSSSEYRTISMDFTSMADKNQGCVKTDGNFYQAVKSTSSRDSQAYLKKTGKATLTMDLAWSTTSSDQAYIDRTAGAGEGKWHGYAKLTSGVPAGKEWVWFDWTCSGLSAAAAASCTADESSKYWVKTDYDTGKITGYAWNDYLGFIPFSGLTQELPPLEIKTYVDILSSADAEPDDVTATDAPLADGYDYWRISVQFQDTATGEFLTESDISSLTITESETSDSKVYLNQVENSGNAITTSYKNTYTSCGTNTTPCVETESDGSVSFNKYIYSGAPTSNVLGLNDDSDSAIEYYSDRAGCRWIYRDQVEEVDGLTYPKKCPVSTGITFEKDDVFYERANNRNKYEILYVALDVEFNTTVETSMVEWDDSATGGSTFGEVTLAGTSVYAYLPADGSADLSYRPRYQITKFVANYDSDEHQRISDEFEKTMSLKTEATVADTSAAYRAAGGGSKPGYSVYYQMDALSTNSEPTPGDKFLLIDTDVPPSGATSADVEETWRKDTLPKNYASGLYQKNYAIGYGQKASECPGEGSCAPGTNTLSAPTAEQWVCDTASEMRNSGNSCYYTEYLPHIDRHQDPTGMFVIGAINSVLQDDDLETAASANSTALSVLGNADTIKLRNKMYAQVVRYTLGQTAGSGTLDSDMEPTTSSIVELMAGRLLFAQGDVVVTGSSSFSSKTLVVIGGDVFIKGDIEGGRLGIVSFRKSGKGGNVYIRNDAVNLNANLFLDGSVFSYAGTFSSSTDYVSWASDEDRLEALMNQLYFKGSIISRNTVNGAKDDTASSWELGDGNTTTDYDEAREYDLSKLRQFRLCYGINTDGTLDYDTTEACDEGEKLSSYGEENGVYNSLIIEYSPASDLPIFTAESGMFN